MGDAQGECFTHLAVHKLFGIAISCSFAMEMIDDTTESLSFELLSTAFCRAIEFTNKTARICQNGNPKSVKALFL
jgi:hypothetical protein